jgi:hypothetical protein
LLLGEITLLEQPKSLYATTTSRQIKGSRTYGGVRHNSQECMKVSSGDSRLDLELGQAFSADNAAANQKENSRDLGLVWNDFAPLGALFCCKTTFGYRVIIS